MLYIQLIVHNTQKEEKQAQTER